MRRGIEEPHPHEPRGVDRVLLASGVCIRERQRRHRAAEPSEVVAIGDLADLGITLAVLAEVRLAVRL
jgi:hypothetical protein